MKKLWITIAVAGLILFIPLDMFAAEHHVDFPWLHVPAFFSIFGLLGCLLLVGFAKLIGHYWLQRREDYYDRNDDDDK